MEEDDTFKVRPAGCFVEDCVVRLRDRRLMSQNNQLVPALQQRLEGRSTDGIEVGGRAGADPEDKHGNSYAPAAGLAVRLTTLERQRRSM